MKFKPEKSRDRRFVSTAIDFSGATSLSRVKSDEKLTDVISERSRKVLDASEFRIFEIRVPPHSLVEDSYFTDKLSSYPPVPCVGSDDRHDIQSQGSCPVVDP